MTPQHLLPPERTGKAFWDGEPLIPIFTLWEKGNDMPRVFIAPLPRALSKKGTVLYLADGSTITATGKKLGKAHACEDTSLFAYEPTPPEWAYDAARRSRETDRICKQVVKADKAARKSRHIVC